MKNLTLLFALLFSLILSTSCEKEEMVTPTPTNDLIGQWNFKSLTYNGLTTDATNTCENDQLIDIDFTQINLNFENNTVDMLLVCSNHPKHYDYSILDNYLTFTSAGLIVFKYKFELNKTELKLNLITDNSSGAPLNGTYTLIKQ